MRGKSNNKVVQQVDFESNIIALLLRWELSVVCLVSLETFNEISIASHQSTNYSLSHIREIASTQSIAQKSLILAGQSFAVIDDDGSCKL